MRALAIINSLRTVVLGLMGASVWVPTSIAGHVDFEQVSEPAGIVSAFSYQARGGTATTVAPPLVSGGLRFVYWTAQGGGYNGERFAADTGRSLHVASFVIDGATTLTAHYVDVNMASAGNGIPDWWQFYQLGELAADADVSLHDDGFSLREVYRRGYDPHFPQSVVDGGVSARLSPVVYLVHADQIAWSVASEPTGILSASGFAFPGETITTPEAARFHNDLAFTAWTIDGVRQGVADNGRAYRRLAWTVPEGRTQPAALVAHYVERSRDTSGDGVPDWWLLHYLNNATANTLRSADGDSFTLAEEYRRGYSPRIPDTVRDGGVSARLSPVIYLVNPDQLPYTTRSQPTGLYSGSGFLFPGESYTAPEAALLRDGLAFAGWDVNGSPVRDADGRALRRFTWELPEDFSGELVFTANYVEAALVSDPNGVPDWWLLYHFGTTQVDTATSHDGDLFTRVQEFRRGYDPHIHDLVVDGGVSARLTPVILVNLSPYQEWATLTASVQPEGTGAVQGAGGYLLNHSATLRATAASGYRFSHWSGDLTGTKNPTTLVMTGDLAVTAHFVELTLAYAMGDGLDYITGGNQPWFAQTAVTRTGAPAAQSGPIGHKQESWIETTVEGPGTLSFWWRVSSEENYDFLEFWVNGSQHSRISGESAWQQTVLELEAGWHTLRWRYMKDGSVHHGSDAGWVKSVIWIPAPRLPDFIVESIDLNPATPMEGGAVVATITVRNRGLLAGNGGWLDWWADQPVPPEPGILGDGYSEVGSLEPRATRTFTANFIAGARGQRVFRAFVDSDNDTEELDETNNQLAITYTVLAADAQVMSDWLADHGVPAGQRGAYLRHGPMGLANVHAYVMGLNPFTATAADLPAIHRSGDDSLLRLRYRRNTAIADATMWFEGSYDLIDWFHAMPSAESIVSAEGSVETVDAIFRPPVNGDPLFLRMGAAASGED